MSPNTLPGNSVWNSPKPSWFTLPTYPTPAKVLPDQGQWIVDFSQWIVDLESYGGSLQSAINNITTWPTNSSVPKDKLTVELSDVYGHYQKFLSSDLTYHQATQHLNSFIISGSRQNAHLALLTQSLNATPSNILQQDKKNFTTALTTGLSLVNRLANLKLPNNTTLQSMALQARS